MNMSHPIPKFKKKKENYQVVAYAVPVINLSRSSSFLIFTMPKSTWKPNIAQKTYAIVAVDTDPFAKLDIKMVSYEQPANKGKKIKRVW